MAMLVMVLIIMVVPVLLFGQVIPVPQLFSLSAPLWQLAGAFTGGSVAVYSSLAENGIIADLGLTVTEYSLFGSIMTIGAIIGALISGKMTDVIGRRYTFWILDIFYIMGWLSIIFAKGAWLLDFGRLLLGVGFGITCYVGPVYLAEITPKNLRGGFMSILRYIQSF